MKVKITIEAESVEEVIQHLNQIRLSIALKTDYIQSDSCKNEISISDCNCYGEHEILIYPYQ